MKTKNAFLFVLMNIINYTLVLFAFLLYPLGGPVYIPLAIISQLLLAFFNYKFTYKVWQIVLLSADLILSTVMANRLIIYLFMKNISNDGETAILGNYVFWIGLIFVIFITVTSTVVKAFSLKTKKNNT